MAIDTTNPILQKLFQSPQAGVNANAFITKGNLIMFRYNFWMHDPMPLIIITDYNPGNRIRGINLHYLTYGHISTLLTTASTNPSFSYQNIRGDSYITNAFRSYKWQGIAQVKKFDSQFILQMMANRIQSRTLHHS